jgi:ABC-type polysaccharide/polyol phosphate transport system ATPase subunit
MAHVLLDQISVRYPVYALTGRSLKVSLLRQMVGGRINADAGVVEIEAIRALSLDVKDGARVGLIGRNGSGKSTLLRVLAGVAHPQSGRVSIEGRVVPLLERGLGINPELSGLANIELPMRLLGATSREIKEAKLTIPEFTGLGGFIDMPVRIYSEGMKARLAFAICTAVQGDILVLDEWLGAGDIDFQMRAEERLVSMIQATRIVVFASHSMELIENICNLVVWMEHGDVIMAGPADEVVPAYQLALGATAAELIAAQ